jgi:ecotin
MKTRWTAVGLLAVGAASLCAQDNMKAFPKPTDGMIRCVLHLPKQEDESSRKVELIVGRRMKLDERNQYFFSGKIEAESIRGWGYTKYTVKSLGQMAGTLMAVDPNAKKVERFIALGGEPYLIRYNSRLPIVLYVPEGVEVRYRIWSAGPEMKALEAG